VGGPPLAGGLGTGPLEPLNPAQITPQDASTIGSHMMTDEKIYKM